MPPFYITTAIDYVNAAPHLGHVYEKVCADVIARWRRLCGDRVFFLTGTDENAQKNVQAAREAHVGTKEFVDAMALRFQELCAMYGVSHDRFIRTTEHGHGKVAQEVFERLFQAKQIYKGKYAGLYCQGCEAFYLEKDLVQGKCPEHETRPQWVEEENYFFRLSDYQDRILKHLQAHPEFIHPATVRNEILERLKEPLRDISVSRCNVDWGIPVPFDRTHRIYVWFDALLSYISGLDYPGGHYKTFWPADIHLVGKGITWFHAVIWPAILLAAGLPLPKQVVVHGYITHQGKKMSKSLGNVIDPLTVLGNYPARSDAIRYFLLREVPFGDDGDFTEAALKKRINGELAADLGNLASRVLALASKGVVPEGQPELDEMLDLAAITERMDALELHHALDEVFTFIRACNKYINDKQPWKLEGKELAHVMYNLLEALRITAILTSPFLPETADRLHQQLGTRPGTLKDCRFRPFMGKPAKGDHLFTRIA
ncbi:MAG: methionine--tRNA ligase [Candidatus Aenigmarchaeota archaeon]|nr:methionine--tRNA ligase [Candidatus Aenigmarchaeota archaeon]